MWTRPTRRPRSCSEAKSPAACARISRPKPNGLSGIFSSSPVSSTTWMKTPVFGPALVQLARRVQVARAEAVRHDAAGHVAGARGEPRDRRVGGRGRVHERLDARRSRARPPPRAARRPSPRSRSSTSPPASTSFVLSFAACTFGWSNGLMPRIEPATATPNSQRKNSWPSSYGDSTRTSCAWRSGAVGRLARRGHEALALLAGRLGHELLDPEAEAVRVGHADLVAAVLPAVPEREAEVETRVALAEAAGLGHLLRALEQPPQVDAEQRGRARARTARAPSSGRRSSARPRRSRGTRARARPAPAPSPGR